jgi:hypothetical protein
MTFDAKYYEDKKIRLQMKNQRATQKFLQDTLLYSKEISDIEEDFQEIIKWEKEQIEKETEKVPKKK